MINKTVVLFYFISFLTVSALNDPNDDNPGLIKRSVSTIQTTEWTNSVCSGGLKKRSVGVSTIRTADGKAERHCACLGDDAPGFSLCPSINDSEITCEESFDLNSGSYAAGCNSAPRDHHKSSIDSISLHKDNSCDGKKVGIITKADGNQLCGCETEHDDDSFESCGTDLNSCVQTEETFFRSNRYSSNSGFNSKSVAFCMNDCEETDQTVFGSHNKNCFKLSKRTESSPLKFEFTRSDKGKKKSFQNRIKPSNGPSPTHKPSPSPTMFLHYARSATGSATSTPIPRIRLGQTFDEETSLSDVCLESQRTCDAEDGGFACFDFDDTKNCGGCPGSEKSKDCTKIEGSKSVSCLSSGCVVLECLSGWKKIAEDVCVEID